MPNRSRDSAPVRAGVYTRISWDPAGHGAGVERQRLDCETLCAARGWEVARYFEDYADVRVMPTSGTKPLMRAPSAENLSA